MSEGQLEHFRQILNAWKAELMSEVDRTLNTMQDESTAFLMSMTERLKKKSLRLNYVHVIVSVNSFVKSNNH
jgi:RNA polymerase-binding transcription factor DksA